MFYSNEKALCHPSQPKTLQLFKYHLSILTNPKGCSAPPAVQQSSRAIFLLVNLETRLRQRIFLQAALLPCGVSCCRVMVLITGSFIFLPLGYVYCKYTTLNQKM